MERMGWVKWRGERIEEDKIKGGMERKGWKIFARPHFRSFRRL